MSYTGDGAYATFDLFVCACNCVCVVHRQSQVSNVMSDLCNTVSYKAFAPPIGAYPSRHRLIGRPPAANAAAVRRTPLVPNAKSSPRKIESDNASAPVTSHSLVIVGGPSIAAEVDSRDGCDCKAYRGGLRQTGQRFFRW